MNKLEGRFRKEQGRFRLEVEFHLPGRGITALFGPSGSGKTTLLRCMAGLERAENGFFRIGDKTWQDSTQGLFLPVHKRALGYVFQEASLFPHLNVRGNLEYGWRRVPPAQRRVARDQAIALLGLDRLLTRRTHQLSGGERQRVAMARALLTSPRLLLMDEPLSALDEVSKREILPYLERLHRELELPVIYVSHSLKEVASFADHMLWLESGHLRGQGPMQEMLPRLDLGHALADEAGVVVRARVAEQDEQDRLTALDSPCGRLWVRQLQRPLGAGVRVRLPARDISLGLGPDRDSSILNVWPALVESIAEDNPSQVLVQLRCGQGGEGQLLVARITRRSNRLLDLRPGMQVYARIKSVALLES